MSFKEKVKNLIEDYFKTNESLFLVDFSISATNKIEIVIDGDNGVNLQDCISLSRSIENNLDREELDFSLEVASAGLSNPLVLNRQYKKNIGRNLKVVLVNNEKIEAKLIDITDDFVVLEWSSREPKKIGKGKETIINKKEISFSDIKEATVLVSF